MPIRQARLGWAAGFALLAAGCAVAPPSQTVYEIRGACRDGVPEGAYALVLSNGIAQVTGNFSKGRKHGLFTVFRSSGEKVAEIPYDSDRIHGTVGLWYSPEAGAGQRKLVAEYAAGVLDGTKTSWYADGKPRAVFVYAKGTLERAEAWRPDGTADATWEAESLASRDGAADRTLYEAYESAIRDNLPRCEPHP